MRRFTLYLNKTVVGFYDAVYHRKAQAGSLTDPFGGEERLEHPDSSAFVNSNAGVTDLDTDVPLRLCFAVFSQALSVDGLGPDHKLTPVGHSVARVEAKIQERLVNFVRICQDRWKLTVQLRRYLDRFWERFPHQFAQFLDHSVDICQF